MANYTIFLIIFAVWVLLGVATTLARILGKAFRTPLPPSPPQTPDDTQPGAAHVLSYAAPTIKPSIFRLHPGMAPILAAAEGVAILILPIAPVVPLFLVLHVARNHALVAIVVFSLTLLMMAPLFWLGLRRFDSIPAAARWPLHKLRISWWCGIPAILLVLFLLHLKTQHDLAHVRAQMYAQSDGLVIPVPDGVTNAAEIYREAFPRLTDIPDWVARFSSSEAGDPVPPPALSEEQEKLIPLVHQAAGLPVADWGINRRLNINASLLHLAKLRACATLLRIHAAREAQAGRIDSAIQDIKSIRLIARHAGQGQVLIEGLVALGCDAVAMAATEDVLPFITDERSLEQLLIAPNDEHRNLRTRMFRGEEASAVLFLTDVYSSNSTSLSAFRPLGVILADAEISAIRGIFQDAASVADQDSLKAVSDLKALDARRYERRKLGGIVYSIVIPPVQRPIERSIEVETLQQINNLAIAARKFYLRTGRLPAHFEELIAAGLIQQIPIDPFTGNPIFLTQKQDELILYSVGLDRRDDGGEHVRGKDRTFRIGVKPLWEIDRQTAPPQGGI